MHESPTHPPEAAEEPGALAFTPVPLERVHHNGWNEGRQRDFVTALAAMGSVLHAARAVGMSKQSAYNLRNRPGAESFAAAWDIALAIGYADAFDKALERATTGITTPRFYKGKQVGTRHRFDYRLAMAALNGMPPNAPEPRKKITR
jgi:hypothetical protein